MEEKIDAGLPAFLSSVYKTSGLKYPKFYKMDLLSKLGFMTSTFLVESGALLKPYDPDKVAIVVSNSESSLETDHNYYNTISEPDHYYPNPALFVYTLPNLLIGEISIKYALKGESTFFVSRQPDFETLCTYCSWLLQNTDTQAVMTGWIDLDPLHNYESILFLIEKQDQPARQENAWPFTSNTMTTLYRAIN